MDAAGIDRPDITAFENSSVRTTRQASASQTSEPPPRSSEIQVVIKSDASLLSKKLHLQASSRKVKEPPDKTSKPKRVDIFEEDKSSATATSEVDFLISAESKGGSSTSETCGKLVPHLKKPGTFLRWSLPSGLRRRKQHNLIRKSISQSILKSASRLRTRRLRELEKTLNKPEPARHVSRIQSSSWQQFTAPVPSKISDISRALHKQISPPRSYIATEKGVKSLQSIVAAEEKSSGLVLSAHSVTPKDTLPTKISSMSGQAQEDHEMGGVDDNPVADPKTYPLTDECQHYERRDEVPWDIQKYVQIRSPLYEANFGFRYWSQRYSIFSMYDEGIYMTDDAWFGVTPEPVAK